MSMCAHVCVCVNHKLMPFNLSMYNWGLNDCVAICTNTCLKIKKFCSALIYHKLLMQKESVHL